MGFRKWVLDKLNARPLTAEDSRVYAATVRTGEQTAHRATSSINDVDFGRVARALHGSVWNASSIMAKACSAKPLKLYRHSGIGVHAVKSRPVSAATKSFLCRGASGLEPTVKAMAKAEAEEVEEVTEHPMLRLLDDPDPNTSAGLFLNMLYWYREVAGKCYVYAGPDGGQSPTGLYILHPQYTQANLSKQSLVESYKYGRDTTDYIEIPADRVGRFVYHVDPFRPWDGVSWTNSIEGYADMESAGIASEIARWRNSGQPGMIVSVPMDYTDTQVKQVEEALKNKRGPMAAGTALIVRSASIVQSSAKPHEMGYRDGMLQSEAAIYRACGVPEAVWKLNDANLAGAEMGIELLDRAAWERMKRVAEDLTEWLVPMFGEDPMHMWLGYESPVEDNVEAEAARVLAGFNARAVRVNEYREKLNLQPVDDALNTLGPSIQTATVGGPVAPQAQVQAPKVAEPVKPQTPTPEAIIEQEVNVAATAMNGAQVASLVELATAVRAGTLPVESARAIANAAFPAVSAVILDAVFDPLRPAPVVAEPPAVKSYRRFKVAVKSITPRDPDPRIQSIVNDWLEQAIKRGVAGVNPDGSFDTSIMGGDELQKLIEPIMRDIFEQGAKEAVERLGEGPALSADDAISFAKDNAAKLVKDVVDTTRDSIRDSVTAGIAEGQTINQIQQSIADNAPDISLSRAETIARTETARAYQQGSLDQAIELGWQGKSWLLSGNPCGLCEGAEKAAKNPTPIAEPFFKVGDTIAGTDGKSYTMSRDIMVASDLHPNCSCGTLEVMEMEGES